MEFKVSPAEELLGPFNEIERKNAPANIYFAGDIDLLNSGSRVAIVGSRKASPQGLARAAKLARFLVQRNVIVVSGLAEGIDTAAHLAAIEAGGRTIAVLGTPLDRVYPKKNAALQDLIMKEHLCLSQFPSGTATTRNCFPMRNRTMALISDATVIMEAQDGSGSLHQGWEALRLGRALFIAKSITENPNVTWPQDFLKYGAKILTDQELDTLVDHLPQRVLQSANAEFPF